MRAVARVRAKARRGGEEEDARDQGRRDGVQGCYCRAPRQRLLVLVVMATLLDLLEVVLVLVEEEAL